MQKYEEELLGLLPEDGPGVEPLSTSQVLEKAKRYPRFKYRRAVLRALDDLEYRKLVLVKDRPGRAKYWVRKPGSTGMAGNARAIMRPDQALAMVLLKRFACNQMPALLANELASFIDLAGEVLANLPASAPRHYAKWPGKVAVETGNFSLQLRPILRDVFAAVSQALLMEHEVEIRYAYRTGDPQVKGTEKVSVVQPLGLVEVGGIGYLVASRGDRANPGMYRVDRILEARVLDPFTYPASFSLESYIKRQRSFDFFPEREVRLLLRFSGASGDHLIETPMAANQVVIRNGEYLDVSGTVMVSKRLRWWIRSFGPNVEVLEPLDLRKEFAGEARALAALYAGGTRRTARGAKAAE